MAAFTVPQDTRSYAGDTEYFHQSLRNWQERNHSSRTWDRLTQVQRSAIMRDAQILKNNTAKKPSSPLTVEEVLDRSGIARRLYSF
jgi:hypothetical protein